MPMVILPIKSKSQMLVGVSGFLEKEALACFSDLRSVTRALLLMNTGFKNTI